MPNKCFVPGCKSGYASQSNETEMKKSISLFKPPADMIEVWNKKIPRGDRNLSLKDHVCELHFLDHCIIREKVFKGPDEKDIIHKLCKPALIVGAVPTLFPNLPKYLSTSTVKRKPPKIRTIPQKKNKLQPTESQETQNENEITILLPELSINSPPHPINLDDSNQKCTHEETYNVHLDASNVKLPGTMWGLHTNGTETLFTHITDLKQDKCVRFVSDLPQVSLFNIIIFY